MFIDYAKGMITEYFVRGAVNHIYRGDRGYPLTISYRNGRNIVHKSMPCFVVYCRMSYDGRLLYVGNENCVLHCFDAETLELLWKKENIISRVIVAEDGVIGISEKHEDFLSKINDGTRDGVIDLDQRCNTSLVKINAIDGNIQYGIGCAGNYDDLLHEHFIAETEDNNDTIPGSKIKNLIWMYVRKGSLYSYVKVRNPMAADFYDEVLIDYSLSEEVAKAAEKYSYETEEQLRIMKNLYPVIDPLDPRLLGMFGQNGEVVNKEKFDILKGSMLNEYECRAGDSCTMCNSANDVIYSNLDGSILICKKCFNDFYRMMYFMIIDKLEDEGLAEKRIEKITSGYARTECKLEEIRHISAYLKIETSDEIKYYLTHYHPDNYLKSLCYQDKYRNIKITISGLQEDICYEIVIDPVEKAKAYIYQPEAIRSEYHEGYKELIKDLSDELLENPFTEKLTKYELIQTFSYSTQTPFSNMNVLFDVLTDTMDYFGERGLFLYTFYDGKIKECYKYDITKDFKISGCLNEAGSFLLFSEDKKFAIIHSGYGFAAVGGTYEFMKKFRQFMIKNGIHGTQDFVRSYRLYKKDMNSF